jgi:hypothetical protein
MDVMGLMYGFCISFLLSFYPSLSLSLPWFSCSSTLSSSLSSSSHSFIFSPILDCIFELEDRCMDLEQRSNADTRVPLDVIPFLFYYVCLVGNDIRMDMDCTDGCTARAFGWNGLHVCYFILLLHKGGEDGLSFDVY